MFKDVTFGQYFPADSILHRLDPRVKLVVSMAFLVLLFVVQSVWAYIAIGAFIALAVLCSKLPATLLFKNLKPLWFILVFMFIMNIFFNTTGDVLVEFWIIKITYNGVFKAIQLMVRLVMLIFMTGLLTLTTSPISLTAAIESLFSPLKKIKFPAHELAMMMTIALRFIPILMEETDKIMKAQVARGADFDTGGIMQKAKSMIPILIPLFVSAFRRADDLAMAMTARCYNGGDNRTRMNPLVMKSSDYKSIMACIIFFALPIVLEVLL